jgi:predicted DNA-binding transcriptional regulator AlpA
MDKVLDTLRAAQPIQHGDMLLTVKDVSSLLQRSRRSIYLDVSCGRLPKPIKIGKSVRWRRDDVMRAIDALAN